MRSMYSCRFDFHRSCVSHSFPDISERIDSARAAVNLWLGQLLSDLRSSVPVTTEDKNYSRLQKLKSLALAHQAGSARMAFSDALAGLSAEDVAKTNEDGCAGVSQGEVVCEGRDIITCIAEAQGPYEGIVPASWRMLSKLPGPTQAAAVKSLESALGMWPQRR